MLNALNEQKVIIIYGARQVGKTTLLKSLQKIQEERGVKTLYLNMDISEDKDIFNTTSISRLKSLVAQYEMLLIDEAQRLEDPGLTAKIIADTFPKKKIRALAIME